jgi:hypothetical protein
MSVLGKGKRDLEVEDDIEPVLRKVKSAKTTSSRASGVPSQSPEGQDISPNASSGNVITFHENTIL